MKTIIHIETINELRTKVFFQIPLPRDAKSIQGIMVTLVGVDVIGNLMKLDSDEAGSLCLQVASAQNSFFAQDFSFRSDGQNLELLPAMQSFFFEKNEPFIHGKRAEFLNLNVPLKINMIEGYFENNLPLDKSQEYRLQIYLKLSLT